MFTFKKFVIYMKCLISFVLLRNDNDNNNNIQPTKVKGASACCTGCLLVLGLKGQVCLHLKVAYLQLAASYGKLRFSPVYPAGIAGAPLPRSSH